MLTEPRVASRTLVRDCAGVYSAARSALERRVAGRRMASGLGQAGLVPPAMPSDRVSHHSFLAHLLRVLRKVRASERYV